MNKFLSLAWAIAAAYLLADVGAAVGVCKQSELGSLLTNPNTTACASDSSVVFADLDGAPSDTQLATICETDSCLSLMAAILAIDPEDCTLPLNENLNLMSELVEPVVNKCTAMGVDVAGSSKVSSGSGVSVGDADSTASDSAASGSSSTSSAVHASSSIATSAFVLVIAALLASTQ
ncbi:unnamed protein product [Phytophthora lilii]|uniref:Elicitin n=1 Tax=Phytophthora lilii TaxID=2077276 RepID=A0A9W6UCM3_9STRA|nr:unnamed protein product [Phytophthora lilii]